MRQKLLRTHPLLPPAPPPLTITAFMFNTPNQTIPCKRPPHIYITTHNTSLSSSQIHDYIQTIPISYLYNAYYSRLVCGEDLLLSCAHVPSTCEDRQTDRHTALPQAPALLHSRVVCIEGQATLIRYVSVQYTHTDYTVR